MNEKGPHRTIGPCIFVEVGPKKVLSKIRRCVLAMGFEVSNAQAIPGIFSVLSL